jgi:hypothetical protein
MKRVVTLGLAAAFAVCGIAGAQAKTVKLEYKHRKGAVDKYRMGMTMQMTMPGMPGAPSGLMLTKMTEVLTQKVLNVYPDGSAKIRFSFDKMKMKMGMPGMGRPEQSVPTRSMTMTMTMSKDGKPLKIEGLSSMMGGAGMAGMDLSQMMGQFGSYGPFPGRPVSVGETWKQAVPLPSFGGNVNVVSTLLAAAVAVGRESAAKIKQTYSGHFDIAEMMKAFAGATPGDAKGGEEARKAMSSMEGAMDFKGWSVTYFSPTRGKMLKTNGSVNVRMNMTMPAAAQQQGAPAQMNMVMDMDIYLRRIK